MSWFYTDRTKRHHCIILVRCMYSGLVGGLLFAARAALMASVGELACLMLQSDVIVRHAEAIRN